jgi:hypothetical protein
MSYCAIIEFRNGIADTEQSFGNSWGGAARIWTAVYDKYLKDPNVQYDNWLTDSSKPNCRLWKLHEDSRLFEFDKVVHVATYDDCIIRNENFVKFAAHLREFSAAYQLEGVNHLPAWAKFIEESNAEAVGFYHTSVCENPWVSWNDDDESVPYSLLTGDKHWELYEELLKPV